MTHDATHPSPETGANQTLHARLALTSPDASAGAASPVWQPRGRLTIDRAASLHADLAEAFAQGATGIDLAGIERIDTAGCQLLLKAAAEARLQARAWHVTRATPDVLETLRRLGASVPLGLDLAAGAMIASDDASSIVGAGDSAAGFATGLAIGAAGESAGEGAGASAGEFAGDGAAATIAPAVTMAPQVPLTPLASPASTAASQEATVSPREGLDP